MSARIEKLIAEMKQHDLIPASIEIDYDPMDLALPEAVLNAKRIIEYILAQPVYMTDENRFTGMLRFDKAVVPADIFHRMHHENFMKAFDAFYNKYRENLVVFEWQHTAPNYDRVIHEGLLPYLENVRKYKEIYKDDPEKYAFEEAMEIVVNGILTRSDQLAKAHEAAADACEDPVRKAELLKLAAACRRVPRYPAESFYEGLQCLIYCFQYLPDSIGTMDRFLRDLYEKDIAGDAITREEAKDLIQEVFVHICNHTPMSGNRNSDFTAECHFAIGGYTADGEDGFTDLSRLIVESLMEIDTRRPSISLRWTKKTSFEVLKFMLDCERNDKNKRIAFCNDEPRLKGLTEIVHIPYEEAVKYTMVGCNEPSFPGTVWYGGMTVNIARPVTDVLYNRTEDAVNCADFEEFYAVFREELDKDLKRMFEYSDAFNRMRAKDINVLSCFMIDGCVEAGRSATAGACKWKIGGANLMGQTCLIDSLSIIKQYVFEEKKTTMAHLIDVLKSDWALDEELHADILKNGRFFGNHDPLSDAMARRISTDLCAISGEIHTVFDFPILFGTLAGYNPHFGEFGKRTAATPDGRYAGDTFMVGTGQCNGKDRNGLLALMQSVAQIDPTGIMTGPVVINMMIDAALMKNDEYFEKICKLLETYFKIGGIQFQLNYVTKEELEAALKAPENYRDLKVRVSGYSGTFVILNEGIQKEILQRTVKQ